MFQLIQISAKRMSQKTNSATKQLQCITEDSVNSKCFFKASWQNTYSEDSGLLNPTDQGEASKGNHRDVCVCLWDAENVEQFQGQK